MTALIETAGAVGVGSSAVLGVMVYLLLAWILMWPDWTWDGLSAAQSAVAGLWRWRRRQHPLRMAVKTWRIKWRGNRVLRKYLAEYSCGGPRRKPWRVEVLKYSRVPCASECPEESSAAPPHHTSGLSATPQAGTTSPLNRSNRD